MTPMISSQKAILLLILCGILSSCDNSWQSEYVYFGKDGNLHYTPDEKGNIIPDFSHVGYRFGDVSIPEIPVVLEIEPIVGDNGKHLQNAIDIVSQMPLQENGYRGAVLLKKGRYPVEESLYLHTSGVVLKGEGQELDGTVIVASGNRKRSLLITGGAGQREEIPDTRVRIAEEFTPAGRKFLVVESAKDFLQGDDILLYRPGTQKWVTDLKMDSFPERDDGRKVFGWPPGNFDLWFEREITDIRGDTLFFRNPLVMPLEEQYGGGWVMKYRFDGRIENTGIENICFISEYTHEEDENHGWNAIQYQNISHSWVRNVTARHFGYACVNVASTARNITVTDCSNLDPVSKIDGGRRYAFKCDGQFILFKNLISTHGRHDFATGSRVAGPNVFTNCVATNSYNDIGPHHRWAMGTLYDRIVTDGTINVQDRGNLGTGQGWAGVTQVFWNCAAESSICQSPWVTGKNYNIGFTGLKNPGINPERPDGYWEGHNKTGLVPESLYEAQLKNRMKKANL
jgi:hypothetical protein